MKKITFDKNTIDAIICLDADLPDNDFFKTWTTNIPILAADGAAISLFNKGIIADYVIGDLDSFKISPNAKYFPANKIFHIEEQDTNDFEKTLKFAISKNYKNLLIIGFHGGLLEHTLNNWSVFSRYSKLLNICIYEKNRYAFFINESLTMPVKNGEIISLIPQTKAVITTKNLFWKLNNEALELGCREGARNKATDNFIEIEIHSGELLIFIDARLPYIQ